MTRDPVKPDELLEQAVAAVRDEPIDRPALAAARGRVERRLAAGTAALIAAAGDADAGRGAPPDTHRIEGCAGFRALIPAHLAAALSEPKRLLLEDHLRECVPCRRALAAARRGRGPAATTAQRDAGRPEAGSTAARWRSRGRLALAASLAGLAAIGAWLAASRLGWTGPVVSARVQAIDGELLAIDGELARPLSAGETVGSGRTLRTASGSGAVIALADGTKIELAERSEMALARKRDGIIIGLDRGAMIVEAAEQRGGHLYARTDECMVSVVGTIFAVSHGVRGSRVSVLDGEVEVRSSGATDSGGRLAVLRPGDQIATSARLARVPLEQEVAWSRNASAYSERVEALAALGRELDQTIAAPGERTSTRLLDLAPERTALWAGLPNVSGQLAEAWALVAERASENPALADWWRDRFAGGEAEREITDAVARLREVGAHLGPEIAVAVALDAEGRPEEPLLLAEIADPAGLDALLDAEIARIDAEARARGDADEPRLRRVTDLAAAGDSGDDAMLIWQATDDLLAVSPSARRLSELASALAEGRGGLAGSRFHARLAEAYAGGAAWLLGIDASALASDAERASGGRGAALGLADAEHVVIESKTAGTTTESRASLDFRGERRGIASWLAAPAPSGALEFVSPDAAFAVAGIVKQPAAMFDDLLAAVAAAGGTEEARRKLGEIEAELGVSVRDDLAASLGGDFALAIDGPWLPRPSWKVVVEVLDPGRLEFALARAVEALGREAAEDIGSRLRLGQEEVDGRVYLRIAGEDGVVHAYLSFADGYLVAAPSRALVAEAIARRTAGASLAGSRAFLDRLPRDAEPDVSALLWQNAGAAGGALRGLLASAPVTAEQPAEIEALAAAGGPTLIVAYGEPERIRLVAQGPGGPFGFSLERLLAVAGALRQ